MVTQAPRYQTFPDYTIRNGLLIYFDGLKSRVCVSTSFRGRFLEIRHESPLGGHTRKLKYEMMSQFFWPQMSSHIGKYVAWCAHYQRNKSYNSSTRDIPQPHAMSSCRFDVVSVDLLSGFPTTKNGYDCIVVFTDRLEVPQCTVISTSSSSTSSYPATELVIFLVHTSRNYRKPHTRLYFLM